MRSRIRTIAVIGGGPGGAHCARRLARRGFDVTLFEHRASFEKACGGGIPIRGIERFPFLDSPRLPGKTIRRCLLIAPSGRETDLPLLDPLHVFSRADLHTFLLERAVEAGVALVRARVVSFARDGWTEGAGRAAGSGRAEGGGWILRTATSGPAGDPPGGAACGPFDFLVAADGATGSARRRLGCGPDGAGLAQGIGYYLPALSEDRITLKFYEGLDGYLWIFPRPGHSSAGICAELGGRPAAALKGLMDRFLAERFGADLLARSERYAALIPGAPRDPASGRVHGEGWALVGDAGRFVDPLTREGIYYAMLTGEMLADCLAARRPERYGAAWTRRCGRELSWAARHARAFFDARFVERLVALCDRSPTAGRVLSDLIAGRQAYRDLKRRLLLNAPRIGMQIWARPGGGRGRSALRPARDS